MNTVEKLRVIMLDFDGVIRVPSSGLVLTPDHFEFCPDRMRDLAKVCETLDLKIVVSSDWRNFEKKGEIERLIGPLARYLHEDWMTPVIGHRWQEVAFWIMRHEPDTYIILEDLEMHYEDASPEMKKRIVWCETHKGITKKQIKEIYDKYE